MNVAIGIDYSMTCPAACAVSNTSALFWYAHTTKCPMIPCVTAIKVPETHSIIERADFLARELYKWVKLYNTASVGLEDYAFAATGRVFHIGENTGVMKHLLWTKGLDVTVYPPTVIKKFATGKGNADKNKMTAAFVEAYPAAREWVAEFFPRTKDNIPAKSPLSDLADAYWIAKYQHSR